MRFTSFYTYKNKNCAFWSLCRWKFAVRRSIGSKQLKIVLFDRSVDKNCWSKSHYKRIIDNYAFNRSVLMKNALFDRNVDGIFLSGVHRNREIKNCILTLNVKMKIAFINRFVDENSKSDVQRKQNFKNCPFWSLCISEFSVQKSEDAKSWKMRFKAFCKNKNCS